MCSRMSRSVCSPEMRSVKSRRVNSKWSERNLLIKGMGDEILIGLLHIMPNIMHKTPITH